MYRSLLPALLLPGLPGLATAAELTIGLGAAITSVDPHVAFGPNRAIAMHVYEPLVRSGDRQEPEPGLALSWATADAMRWEFRLRPGVTFQDGTPFTAEDAAFSLRRAASGEGPRSYRSYTRGIVGLELKDPVTLVVVTGQAAPLLPRNLSTFGMVSARAAADATEADFDGGRAAVGTGPYRLLGWSRGAAVTLARNERHWGEWPAWDKVTFRFIPNDTARVAALLAGDLDLIDAVPASLNQTILGRQGLSLTATTTGMLNYLQLDQRLPVPTGVSAFHGGALPGNPFRDLRVRQAMTLAVDRDAIAGRVMQGQAEPSGQLVPPGLSGHVEGLPPATPDPARARALLAAAGYPQGFRVTLRCTGDRYPNDAKVCEALAQMFSRIGIRTTLEVLPAAVFFPRSDPAGTAGDAGLGLAMTARAALAAPMAGAMAGRISTASSRPRCTSPTLPRGSARSKQRPGWPWRMSALSLSTSSVPNGHTATGCICVRARMARPSP